MAGDTANARSWANADVYTAPLATTPPTDLVTAWGTGWDALGLLAQEDSPVWSRDQDSTDTYAYGDILVRSTRSKQKRSVKVVALEDNATVWALVNPGSPAPATATGVETRQIFTPKPDKRMFGMQLGEGDTTLRRWFTGEIVEVGEINEAQGNVVAFEFTINVYPDASGLLYTELVTAAA